MNRQLPHVLLNTNIQKDSSVKMKYNYGFGKKQEAEDNKINSNPDYINIGQNLEAPYIQFKKARRKRVSRRNESLSIPFHVDFVRIDFWGQFAVKDYFQRWYDQFGLEVVEVSNFGTSVLFGVIDMNHNKLDVFLSAINKAIGNSKNHQREQYPKLINYVKNFELLTTEDILNNVFPAEIIILKIADLMVHNQDFDVLIESLKTYLSDRGFEYTLNKDIGVLEIFNKEGLDLEEIINNFDVVLQVTSGRATLVKPDIFNVATRGYGFEVLEDTNLPLVGVIDSGISSHTPLSPLIVVDEDLNLTTSSVIEDNVDRRRGHGTAVGGLLSLGAEAVRNEYSGQLRPHCLLLPIKIIDSDSSSISISEVLRLLEKAIIKYPQIKIFTLTINFDQNKKYNEHYSSYAYALDKFSFENDCLIFISTGNYSQAILQTNGYDLSSFKNEESNLCSPAESLNNITVGACADSLREGAYVGISNGPDFPTLYSRKGHYHYELLKGKTKINKELFKPDLLMSGGDYNCGSTGLTDTGDGSMLLLSADRTESFYRAIGTSYATPLAANIAVQIQKKYPSLRAASIKALMLNHCSNKIGEVDDLDINTSMLNGHGIINAKRAVYSDSNTINFILEESIDHEELKVIPLKFPDYLMYEDLKKKNQILKVTATISYQFFPVRESQLGYCPVMIAFGFFKNHEGEEILMPENKKSSKLKSGRMWSQNCRYKKEPNPFSNTQKIRFVVNVADLVNEEGVFKIGVHCYTHPQLRPGEDEVYQKNNKFSIAICIEENLKESTDLLYQEMIEINNVSNILSTALDQNLEAEV